MATVLEMGSFFDHVSDGYDEHMENNIDGFHAYYKKITDTVPQSKEKISVLDLGCGTGLEIEGIFKRAPRAQITGIDLSKEMLRLLEEKYKDKMDQIQLINDSYVTYPFESNTYDCVLSTMTMHHFEYEDKKKIYKRICESLSPEAYYIEGDYIVDTYEEEQERLMNYGELMKDADPSKLYHIDIPLSEERQMQVLKEAGFKKVDVIFAADFNRIFVAHK